VTTAPLGRTGRQSRWADPARAFAFLLEQALTRSGLERGSVLYREGSTYRTVGRGSVLVRAVRAEAADPESALARALREGVAQAIEGPGDTGQLRLVPLGGSDPWAAMVLGEEARSDQLDAVEAVIREHGPRLEEIRRHQLERDVERLTTERDMYRAIFDNLHSPVVLTDPANAIRLANRRAHHLFSVAAGDSAGRRGAVQLNNLLLESFLSQEVHPGGGVRDRELTLVHPTDGSDLLFEVVPGPGSSEARPGGRLSILRDITDLKQAVSQMEAQYKRSLAAEGRVRQEWERLSATLENVGDPILVTDGHADVILTNRQAEQLFDPDVHDPDSPEQWAARANDDKLTAMVNECLHAPGARRVETFELQIPGGGTGPAEIVSSKVLDARGEVSAIVSVIHDLTQVVENERLAAELKQLNEELEDRIRLATMELEERNRRLEWQSRELEKASRLKSEFLASMSHELRTPINAVLGYTSLMREQIYGSLTEKQRTGLDKINSASQHLLDLINDILDLSKIEAGKMPVYLEEVSLQHVVTELSEAVDPLVREKDLALHVDIEEGLPALFTDRTKLKQILLNLLSNAVKFTAEGEIRLIARRRGERVTISVEDTGVGIREADLEAIFDDFRQVDQSPTREHGGTGLGLSITRKLVALLDGDLDVESTYGEGTRFVVELPWRLQPGTREDQVQRALASSGRGHGDPDGEPLPSD
jgi:PAS domain S-box-containing protein